MSLTRAKRSDFIGEVFNKLLKIGADIQITREVRRGDKDSSGKRLPNGKDFYALQCYRIEVGNMVIENEWPGFYDNFDMMLDINEGLKFLQGKS